MSTPSPSPPVVDGAPGAPDPAPAPPLTDRAPRAAWWTFVALAAVAVVVYAIEGRGQWFYQDEWVFLSQRDAHTADGLFRAHSQHWVTLPVLIYRGWYNLFGLSSYKPYQALSISAAVAACVMLRVVMRRMGVGPWVATAAATAVLFFGTGAANVVWGFQIAFGAALTLGLAHLVLADHPAPNLPRYLGGAACGIAALMFSGVGLVMAGVVGLAVLLRQGWRRAAVTVAPLAVAYAAWWLAYGRSSPGPASRSDLSDIPPFVLHGLGYATTSATWILPVTLAVGLVTVVGLGLLVTQDRGSLDRLRHDLGIPLALAAGGVAFFILVASSRASTFGNGYATRSRFAHVAVVLLAPLVALAFDAVIRRWRTAAIPLVALLLVGIPSNVAAIEVQENRGVPPALILAVAHSDALAAADPSLEPFPDKATGIRNVTAGWLLDQVEAGRLPEAGEPTPEVAAEVLALVALQPAPKGTALGPCRPLRAREQVELGAGEVVGYRGNVVVRVLTEGGGRSAPLRVGALRPRGLTAVGVPLTLAVTPSPDDFPEEICLPS